MNVRNSLTHTILACRRGLKFRHVSLARLCCLSLPDLFVIEMLRHSSLPMKEMARFFPVSVSLYIYLFSGPISFFFFSPNTSQSHPFRSQTLESFYFFSTTSVLHCPRQRPFKFRILQVIFSILFFSCYNRQFIKQEYIVNCKKE